MRYLKCIAISAVMTAVADQSFALDVITRKNDKPAQGTIQSITRESVVIKPGVSQPITVPANVIVDIQFNVEPADLNLGRAAERSGDFKRALDMFDKASKDRNASGDNVKTDIEFLIARVSAKEALQKDSSKLGAAASKLDAFVKAHGTSFRYFEAIALHGQVLLQQKEFDQASQAFERLAQAPWPDYKMAARNATGRLAMAKGDLPAALNSYNEVLGLNAGSAAELSRRNEALLGKASVLIAQSSHDEALKSIVEAIGKADPEDAAVQAEGYVLKGDCLQALGQSKQAILAYLHVPLLFEKEQVLHARALYNLTLLWPKVDQPERALQARQELTENFPDSPWAKKLQ